MSLLGYGLLFRKLKEKENNEELYLCLTEDLQQLLLLKLERTFYKSNFFLKKLYRVFTDESLYESYCVPLKCIMKLTVKNSGCLAIPMIISSVIRRGLTVQSCMQALHSVIEHQAY